MKQIELRGKYAVGEHRYTLVDDDMFEYLNQWKWKALPNGSKNNIYAIRNEKGDDGITRCVRMHRVILGYTGHLDIDHINHNALDNRRENLRVVSRRANVLNCRRYTYAGECAQCKRSFVCADQRVGSSRKYCGTKCARAAELERERSNRAKMPKPAVKAACLWCHAEYRVLRPSHVYCSEPCKKAAKWKRQRSAGMLPPSVKKLGSVAVR